MSSVEAGLRPFVEAGLQPRLQADLKVRLYVPLSLLVDGRWADDAHHVDHAAAVAQRHFDRAFQAGNVACSVRIAATA